MKNPDRSPSPAAPLPWAEFCFWLGILIAWLAVLSGSLALWHSRGTPIIPGLRSGLIIGGGLALLGAIRLGFSPRRWTPSPIAAATALALLFFSDWLTRGYNLFQGPSIRGEIVVAAGLMWWILRARAFTVLNAGALLAAPILAGCFLAAADGRLLFSDDHPVFLFRLISLKENFPLIPFFNPLWNGGIDQRDFFATGALNIFLPLWPLIRAFDVVSIYNLIVAIVIFGIGPAATYLGARIERLPSPAPALAALLHITVSLLWYRWGLKYGTMGFVMSASLVPLNLSLISVIFSADRPLSRPLLALATASLSLMVCWSLAGIVLLPALLLGLLFCRRVLTKRFVPTLLGLLLAINLPWMSLFWAVSNVGKFVKAEKPAATVAAVEGQSVPGAERRTFRHRSREANLKESVKVLREGGISTNPLIFLFALPGLFLLRRESRTVFGATGLWLLFLGTICVPLKPQLELDRMLLILALVGALPAAHALTALFERAAGPDRGLLPRALAALAGGFLLAGPFAVSGIVHNRSVEHFFFADSTVTEIAEAFKTHGGDGRILFSGFVLHELSNGHLAPLTAMTGRPLMASSFAHDKWRYEQIFPEYYLAQKDVGIERYLDLYNVTAVVAHEPTWRNYFRSRSADYREVWRGGRFVLFARLKSPSGYFLSGAGEIIEQQSNGVKLRLASPEAVIKFNYFNFLTADGCTVAPHPLDGGATLTALSNCPVNKEITLRSVPPFTRLMHHE